MSALARYGYWVAVAILSLAALILGGFIVVRIAIPELQNAGYLGLGVAPSPTKLVPSPSPVASGFPMGNVVLPANADCAGCHQTNSGAIGLKPIPVMGHPLEGWSQCTACHALISVSNLVK